MKDVLSKISKHKIVSLVLVALLIWAGYYVYGKLHSATAETRYILSAVAKGTLVSSVSGAGQVSVLNQLDLKPKVSGNVTSIKVSEGQVIKSGTLILQLDSTEAARAVRDAQVNLDSANLQLSILRESSANVDKLVSDGFNEVSATFLDLPTIISGLDSALHDKTISSYENLVNPNDHGLVEPLIQAAEYSYGGTRTAYNAAFDRYHSVNRYDSSSTIVGFIGETSAVSTKLADAVKDTINLIDFINDYNVQRSRSLLSVQANLISGYRNNLSNYTAILNPHISSLANTLSLIDNAPLNINSQELSIHQRENALLDARETLADYSIRAPFDGIVAKINVKKSDPASPGTAVATIITNQQTATVSLNEVDVAKVVMGQKATLTFDAFPDLTIAGKVTQVDTIGTITQGVVNYNINIVFETQDNRIKPAMSVTAAIITDTRQNVLLAPNAAVKSQGNGYYVEVLDGVKGASPANLSNQGVTSPTPPRQQAVEVGASNDSKTEITSGLGEGDFIVTRSITATATSQPTTQSSGFGGIRIPGVTGGGR